MASRASLFSRGTFVCSLVAALLAPSAALAQREASAPAPSYEASVRTGSARAPALVRACERTEVVDWYGYVSGAALIGLGAGLAAWQLMIPPPERTTAGWFAVGIGPGLVLGGIGVPIGRGALRGASDPLARACARVREAHRRGDALEPFDEEHAARLLRAHSAGPSALLLSLLTAATVAVTGGAIAALAVGHNELAQLTGGISAAAVAGWFIMPPTPVRVGAMQFVTETQGVGLVRSGYGLSLTASF